MGDSVDSIHPFLPRFLGAHSFKPIVLVGEDRGSIPPIDRKQFNQALREAYGDRREDGRRRSNREWEQLLVPLNETLSRSFLRSALLKFTTIATLFLFSLMSRDAQNVRSVIDSSSEAYSTVKPPEKELPKNPEPPTPRRMPDDSKDPGLYITTFRAPQERLFFQPAHTEQSTRRQVPRMQTR